MRAKLVNEAIKHLAPKSKKEIKSADEQLIEEMKEALKAGLDFDPGEEVNIKVSKHRNGDMDVSARSLEVRWKITYRKNDDIYEVSWINKRGRGNSFIEETLADARSGLAQEYEYYMEEL